MRFAGVFPGQGSQSIGMMDGLMPVNPVIAQTLDEASEALDLDVARLLSTGPESELNRTENTQPILLATSVAVWRLWLASGGPEPAVFAGHSLGEYTALVAAGAINFADALSLVRLRGRLMQDAVPVGEGAMAALIGLDEPVVQSICEACAEGEVVAPANLNAPGQIVIAGNREAVNRASEKARSSGAKRVIALPVSVPSHCTLMRSAADQLGQVLRNIPIRQPRIPIIHNVDARVHPQIDEIRDALSAQLYRPVRWTDVVYEMQTRFHVQAQVEFGPGKVLSGLARRIDRSLKVLPIQDGDSFGAALASVREET